MSEKEKLNELFDSLKKMMGEPKVADPDWRTPIGHNDSPISNETLYLAGVIGEEAYLESFFSKNPMADKERDIYRLIDKYRSMLLNSSKEAGDTDSNIHHDIVAKNDDHKNIVKSIANLFSLIHDSEKGSDKLKPSFFSDTIFEKIARYAKRKLGYHADDIAIHLTQINSASTKDLYKIWQPGSWLL